MQQTTDADTEVPDASNRPQDGEQIQSENAEHKKGARKSTQEKHEGGQTRKQQDAGGEKGDQGRRPPRKQPPGHKGPWPPKK